MDEKEIEEKIASVSGSGEKKNSPGFSPAHELSMDEFSDSGRKNGRSWLKWLALLLVVLSLGFFGWYFWPGSAPPRGEIFLSTQLLKKSQTSEQAAFSVDESVVFYLDIRDYPLPGKKILVDIRKDWNRSAPAGEGDTKEKPVEGPAKEKSTADKTDPANDTGEKTDKPRRFQPKREVKPLVPGEKRQLIFYQHGQFRRLGPGYYSIQILDEKEELVAKKEFEVLP